MKPWEKLLPIREKAYNSDKKVILDNYIQGTGKTLSDTGIMIENNKNNVAFFNDHELIHEMWTSIYSTRGIGGWIKNYPFINLMFGKTYILKDYERKAYGKKLSCFCNQYEDESIFNLIRMGFIPSNYCNDICPYSNECAHKAQIRENFNMAKLDFNSLWLLVKPYMFTDIMDGIFDKFKNLNVLIDENFFDKLIDQIDLRAFIVSLYKKAISDVLNVNSELEELWNDFVPLLDKIINNISHGRSLTIKKKIRVITDDIFEFLNSYEVSDLCKWNEIMKHTFLQNNGTITPKISNVMNSFIDMFNDIELLGDKDVVNNRMLLDDRDHFFSYIINKRNFITNIIEHSDKAILTDATATPDIIEAIFPEYKDNYIFLEDRDNKYKPIYKSVNIKTAGKRGEYKKEILFNRNKYTPSFDKLIECAKQIVQKEGNRKGLIISFKDFIKKIHKELKTLIKRGVYDIVYAYFYNIEGKNLYSDRDYLIIFGSCNKPKRFRDTISKMLNIDESILEYIYGPAHQLQCIGRLRAINRPGECSIYLLNNVLKDHFPNARRFNNLNEVLYSDILDWIRLQNGVSSNEAQEFLNKTMFSKEPKKKQSIINILNTLVREGLLKSRKEKRSSGPGASSWYWYTI